MEVRDATEGDADVLADFVDGPTDVLRNVIHDRTVRVATEDDRPIGFLSFDARPGTVYVTQIGGDPEACERLLEEPIRFAAGESMAVELLVTTSEGSIRDALTRSGFEEVGPGPGFSGNATVKYRLEPGEPDQA